MDRTYLHICLTLVLCVALSACAGPSASYKTASKIEIDREIHIQKTMAFEQKIKEQERVEAIAYKILTVNAELCDTPNQHLGLTLWNAYSLNSKDREIAHTTYNLDHVYQIKYVHLGSPAAQQDIRVGDKVIAINTVDVSSKKISSQKLSKALNRNNHDSDNSVQPVQLILMRGHQTLHKDIHPTLLCPYTINYNSESMDINAFTNGKSITITRGMYRFAQSDNELALVIGHEIGHNIMKHHVKKSYNQNLGVLSGAIIDITLNSHGYRLSKGLTDTIRTLSRQINSVKFEREADYVGLYMTERAGYDTAQAINLWRRMAVEYKSTSIDKRSTHPATAERFIYLEKPRQELIDKKKSGQELLPDFKAL
jgi:hypothetical protein